MRNRSSVPLIRRIGSLLLALSIGLMLLSTVAVAEEVEPELGYIGIGGQVIEYPLQETSYWFYDEMTGVIAAAAEEKANVTLIPVDLTTLPETDQPTVQSDEELPPEEEDHTLLIVQLNRVHITTTHHFDGSDYPDFALFYPGNHLAVQALGDCSLTGTSFGIYANGYLTLNGLDSHSTLTVTAEQEPIITLSLTDEGGFEPPQAIVSVFTTLVYNEDASDFVLTVRSNTGHLISNEPLLIGSRVELYTSESFDGADPTRHVMNDEGEFDVENINLYPYAQYRVGTEVFAPVQVTGATLQFQPGDKPVFTGKVMPEDTEKYTIEEEWALLDEAGTPILWCSSNEENDPPAENRLTTFEAGKTYHYSVYAYTTDPFTVFAKDAKLALNDETITVPEMDSPDPVFTAQFVKEMTPTAAPDYRFEGEGVWTKGSHVTLPLKANGELAKFRSIRVDGAAVAADGYTATAGSTVITLQPAYLETLALGKHTITAVYADGECSTTFTVLPAANSASSSYVKNGETTPYILWLALLFVSGGITAATGCIRRKRA